MKSMRTHTRLAPSEGWLRYSESHALIEYAVSLAHTKGWHYANPTSATIIVEAPASSGSLYLEAREEKVFDAVLYPPDKSDPEFDRVANNLVITFQLKKEHP